MTYVKSLQTQSLTLQPNQPKNHIHIDRNLGSNLSFDEGKGLGCWASAVECSASDGLASAMGGTPPSAVEGSDCAVEGCERGALERFPFDSTAFFVDPDGLAFGG